MTDLRETTGDTTTRRRRSRVWLYGPYVALLVLAVLWSAAWFVIRARAVSEIDGFFAREAAAGRTWTCPNRTVGGYPFRIELRCDAVTFARADLTWNVGPVVAVAQAYQPGLVIVEAKGPLSLKEGATTLDADWRLLQGSFHAGLSGFQRVSLAVDAPKGTVEGVVLGQVTLLPPDAPAPAGPVPAPPPPGAKPVPITFAADHFEAHARPTPGRFTSDGAVDLSARMRRAVFPILDPLLGGPEPVDAELDATIERAAGFGAGPLPLELERWRKAGGQIDLTRLALSKGDRRVLAQGTLTLDEAHRLAGQVQVRAAGLEPLISQMLGQRFGADRGALIGGLVGGLLGGFGRPQGGAAIDQQPGNPGDAALKPLPPLRLADGRVYLGPIGLPAIRLVPLY